MRRQSSDCMMLSRGRTGGTVVFAKARVVPAEFLVRLVNLILESGDRSRSPIVTVMENGANFNIEIPGLHLNHFRPNS